MRLRCAVSVLLLVLTACGSSTAASVPSAGSTGSPTCGPGSARTLAATRFARVYALRGSVYGCAVESHRSYRLGAVERSIREQRVGPLALAGKDAAYGLTSFGIDTIAARVVVRDLADGRQLHTGPAMITTHLPESLESVEAIVVEADGAVAWIAQTNSIIGRGSEVLEVHRIDPRGPALLDVGRSIGPRSLRLRGSTLSWRAAGQTRSATLR